MQVINNEVFDLLRQWLCGVRCDSLALKTFGNVWRHFWLFQLEGATDNLVG